MIPGGDVLALQIGNTGNTKWTFGVSVGTRTSDGTEFVWPSRSVDVGPGETGDVAFPVTWGELGPRDVRVLIYEEAASPLSTVLVDSGWLGERIIVQDGSVPLPSPTPYPGYTLLDGGREIVTVEAGERGHVLLQLDLGQSVEGRVTLVEGTAALCSDTDVDVGFSVLDPVGDVALDMGRVRGSRRFDFIAASSGTFTLVFDNTYSIFTPKMVHLSYQLSVKTAWTRQFGIPDDFVGADSVAVDRVGNVYVAGQASGALPGQKSSGGRDAFVLIVAEARSESGD